MVGTETKNELYLASFTVYNPIKNILTGKQTSKRSERHRYYTINTWTATLCHMPRTSDSTIGGIISRLERCAVGRSKRAIKSQGKKDTATKKLADTV